MEELDQVGPSAGSLVGHNVTGDHLAPQQVLLPGAGLVVLQLSAHRCLPRPRAANIQTSTLW